MTKVYSNDGEAYYHYFPDDLEVGDNYYEADKVEIVPAKLIDLHDIDSFLEDLDCRLFDCVNVEGMDDCFKSVEKEYKQKLLDFIQQWSNKYVNIPYWNVVNAVEQIATEDDV